MLFSQPWGERCVTLTRERERHTHGERETEWETGVSGACQSGRWMDRLTGSESEALRAVIGCVPQGGDVVFYCHFGPKLSWSPECHLNTLHKDRILVIHYSHPHHLVVTLLYFCCWSSCHRYFYKPWLTCILLLLRHATCVKVWKPNFASVRSIASLLYNFTCFTLRFFTPRFPEKKL